MKNNRQIEKELRNLYTDNSLDVNVNAAIAIALFDILKMLSYLAKINSKLDKE